MSQPQPERILSWLPDEPWLVEVRGLVLAHVGDPDALVLSIAPGPSPRSGFVLSEAHGLAAGFGRPDPELADDLRRLASDWEGGAEGLDVRVPMAVAQDWLAAPGVAARGVLRVQTLKGPYPGRAATTGLIHATERIDSPRDPRLETLPRDLRADFAAMQAWPVTFAAFAGGAIASIAHASVETDRFFDVSIETVRDFRRGGFGLSAATALIEHQIDRGKSPVWMARETNLPSLALSRALGFEEVARIQGLRLLHQAGRSARRIGSG